MSWRLAAALDKFRAQVNEHAPSRNKALDGTIGDAKHASRTSDHNPWVKDGKMGIVTALDITHDSGKGVDTWKLADHLRSKRDPRIKYVISNKRIFSSIASPWSWRSYSGSNPHSSHIHISVHSGKIHFDDARAWDLGLGSAPTSPGTPSEPGTPPRPLLRRGSRGELVRSVQRLLMLEVVDGDFGPQTEREVKAFQRNMNLAPDGLVGPLTWTALDKIEQLPRPLDYDDPMELIGGPLAS